MLKFREAAKCGSGSTAVSMYSETLIARRYVLQQKLGSGSFGTVYLVSDKKAKQGEELKVLKEIPIGGLNPNETVQASLEAQLLSKLDHPAIVKFHASFVQQDNFCIITEYCEGRDLDYKIQEYKEAGRLFPENQIIEWFVQLLLGVDYMHERKILHRDLKSKNIFLKNNLLKIGDFGVSRLLLGSYDLASTLTGTPHYMSPEALRHQGYNTKSDIWSLACILYEMCCMNHAFTGSNFLSIVLKIVEGDTPSLPERYPRELNIIMESMLNKSPSLRPSAIEILKIPYIDEQLQHLRGRCSEIEGKTLDRQKETAHIINAMQRKIHLQTLQALSEVQKMTPRERMRLRKLQVVEGKAGKLKKIVEEKYEENNKRMQELRSRNLKQPCIDVLLEEKHLRGREEKEEPPQGGLSCSLQEEDEGGQPGGQEELEESTSRNLTESQPAPPLDLDGLESSREDTLVGLGCHEIPEDPLEAEEYYADVFDSCSEDSEEQEEETMFSGREGEVKDQGSLPAFRTNQHQQDSDVEALVRCLENVLGCTSVDTRTISSVAADKAPGPTIFNTTMARTKMKHMRAILSNRTLSQKYNSNGGVSVQQTLQHLRLHTFVGCYELDTNSTAPNKNNNNGILSDLHMEFVVIFPNSLSRSAMQKLGEEAFEEVYNYLKRARQQNASEAEIQKCLEKVVPRASDCFEVDQLLYFEEQLLIAMGKEPTLWNHH